ncbi:uncharacterized protein LOC119175959 [Rhipicephalus microplus]|uniref:uncharacterized protein LOC119175959 n=1 Tax=Rhipicephalus microplus TaxID=6941 RepID=UPI003F6B7B69
MSLPIPIIISASSTTLPSVFYSVEHLSTSGRIHAVPLEPAAYVIDEPCCDYTAQSKMDVHAPQPYIRNTSDPHELSCGHGTHQSMTSSTLVFACLQIPIIISASSTTLPSVFYSVEHLSTSGRIHAVPLEPAAYVIDEPCCDYTAQSKMDVHAPQPYIRNTSDPHELSCGHGTHQSMTSSTLVFACLQIPIIISASSTTLPSVFYSVEHLSTSGRIHAVPLEPAAYVIDEPCCDYTAQSKMDVHAPQPYIRNTSDPHELSCGHGTHQSMTSSTLVFACLQAQSKGLTKESRQRLLEASDYYIGWLCGEDCQPSPMCTDPLMEMLVRLKATRRGQKPDGKPLIMVDDNLYYRSMRAAWFKLARKYSLGFCQVFLLCSAEQAIQRNATRLLPVPELTIETMVQKFELARDEPWEQLSVAVDGGPGSMEKVMALLDTASKQPWSPMDIVDSITEPTPPGQIHIWDLELRALVSKLIRQAQEEKSTKSELQAWCLMVQKARQNVLAYLRTLDFFNQKEEVDLERLMQEHLDCSASGAS